VLDLLKQIFYFTLR